MEKIRDFGRKYQKVHEQEMKELVQIGTAPGEEIGPEAISVRLEDGRATQFNPMEHRHFDQGYALTTHSSQGLMADRVLINAETDVTSATVNLTLLPMLPIWDLNMAIAAFALGRMNAAREQEITEENMVERRLEAA